MQADRGDGENDVILCMSRSGGPNSAEIKAILHVEKTGAYQRRRMKTHRQSIDAAGKMEG